MDPKAELKAALISIAKKQILELLISKAPVFSSKLLAVPTSWFLGIILEVIIEKTVIGVKIMIIEYQTQHEADEINRLLKEISEVPKDQKDKIDGLENEIIQNAKDLIHLHTERMRV